MNRPRVTAEVTGKPLVDRVDVYQSLLGKSQRPTDTWVFLVRASSLTPWVVATTINPDVKTVINDIVYPKVYRP